MKPDISAIICTYNRPKELQRSIRSLLGQSLSRAMYEIVVVDNSPTKSAHDIVEGFKDADNVRYIHEPTIGLSQARNTGFKNARGDFIAYIDDDATANHEWLALMRRAFMESGVACVGGKVELVLENERPEWLVDELLFCLGELSLSEQPLIVGGTSHYLHGCNIAFRKEVLVTIGGFNHNLGRVGQNLISCEEILVQKKIGDIGGVCLYQPDIVVQHHINKTRLTKKWFLRRIFYEGVSLARMRIYDERPLTNKRVSILIGEIVNLWHKKTRAANDSKSFFVQKCKTRKDIGYIIGLLNS